MFQQVRRVLSGKCHSATTRAPGESFKVLRAGVCVSSSSVAAFRVLSSSVVRSCNHDFAFRYHLAAFQSRVRVFPSFRACQGFAATKLRFAIFSNLSNYEFTSSSSISGGIFCS